MTRKIGIIALLSWTMAITVLRAVRLPNDFAEAHWLLGYQFGFAKRGLIGECLSITSKILAIEITEKLISVLAILAFVIFCVVIFSYSVRIVYRSDWSAETTLVALVFLSSPFIVMSAHLVGYYDNIVMVIGIFSIALLLKGRIWPACFLESLSFLIHENTLLLVIPPFCLAYILSNRRRRQSGVQALPLLPMIVLGLVLIGLVIGQSMLVEKGFVGLFGAHLSKYSFIQDNRNHLVPFWMSRSLVENFHFQAKEFLPRLFMPDMIGLILPSAFAIFLYIVKAFRIREVSLESLMLAGVCFAPQLTHMMAWDTPRIWTYCIFNSFSSLWIYSELFKTQKDISPIGILCITAIVLNAVISTPLMDGRSDSMVLALRACLYLPVFFGSLVLLARRLDSRPNK